QVALRAGADDVGRAGAAVAVGDLHPLLQGARDVEVGHHVVVVDDEAGAVAAAGAVVRLDGDHAGADPLGDAGDGVRGAAGRVAGRVVELALFVRAAAAR